jgi:flagellar basal body-associated protein FliL
MNIETIIGTLLIIVAIVILYFSAVGIAFMWIIKQAQQITEKDNGKNARKP